MAKEGKSPALKDLGASRLTATYYLYNVQTRLVWNSRGMVEHGVADRMNAAISKVSFLKQF